MGHQNSAPTVFLPPIPGDPAGSQGTLLPSRGTIQIRFALSQCDGSASASLPPPPCVHRHRRTSPHQPHTAQVQPDLIRRRPASRSAPAACSARTWPRRGPPPSATAPSASRRSTGRHLNRHVSVAGTVHVHVLGPWIAARYPPTPRRVPSYPSVWCPTPTHLWPTSPSLLRVTPGTSLSFTNSRRRRRIDILNCVCACVTCRPKRP